MQTKYLSLENQAEHNKSAHTRFCTEGNGDEFRKRDTLHEIAGFTTCLVGCIFAAASAVCVKKLNGAVPDLQVIAGSFWITLFIDLGTSRLFYDN